MPAVTFRRAVVLGFALLACLFADLAPPALARAHRPPRCHLSGDPVATTRHVSVVVGEALPGTDGGHPVYGCDDRVGRTRTLYTLDDGGLGTDRLGRVKVVGSWVWFQHDHSDQYGSGGSTIVADTATGRNYSLFGFRQFFNDRVPSYDAIAEHAFLSPHGEVVAAVRGGQHAQAPVTPDDVIEIHAYNGRADRLWDSGRRSDLDPASLRLRGLTARWTARGVTKTVDLP